MRRRADLGDRSRIASSCRLYDADFALWIEEQVGALRAGDVAALDPSAISAPSARSSSGIMTHLLKQRDQPQRAMRRWADSIRDGREQIEDILNQSPSLRRLLPT